MCNTPCVCVCVGGEFRNKAIHSPIYVCTPLCVCLSVCLSLSLFLSVLYIYIYIYIRVFPQHEIYHIRWAPSFWVLICIYGLVTHSSLSLSRQVSYQPTWRLFTIKTTPKYYHSAYVAISLRYFVGVFFSPHLLVLVLVTAPQDAISNSECVL